MVASAPSPSSSYPSAALYYAVPMPAPNSGIRATLVVCTATVQFILGLYLLVCGLVAYEMSALLSVALLSYATGVIVAALFLFGCRRWAWQLSIGLSALALIGGLALSLVSPAWIGAVHAAGAVVVLGALWAIRPCSNFERTRG
jgi:hypothetical protein